MMTPQTFEYAQRNNLPLKLDLYHPGEHVRPLVVFGYGGGFTKGSRENDVHIPLVKRMCDAGFAVAIPDYRLNTGHEDVSAETFAEIRRIANRVKRQGWPLRRRLYDVGLYTACEDISDAIRFCREAATLLNIQEHKIAMLGVSAGGLAGNTLCYPPGVWRRIFCAPDVMVSLAAPVVHTWRIRKNGPPLWIIHGERDKIVPSIASDATADAADTTGAQIKVTIPADAPHIGISKYVLGTNASSGNLYFDDIIAFLKRNTNLPK